MSYADDVLAIVKRKNPVEPEFHQAVEEFLHSIVPVLEQTGVLPGTSFRAALVLELEDGWHINAHEPLQEHLVGTELELEEGDRYVLMGASYPDPIEIEPEFSEEPLAVYEGQVWIHARVKVLPTAEEGNAPLRLTLAAQPCDDTSCARPERHTLELPMRIMEDAPEQRRHEEIFERFGE